MVKGGTDIGGGERPLKAENIAVNFTAFYNKRVFI